MIIPRKEDAQDTRVVTGEVRRADYKTHPTTADLPVGNSTSSQYQHLASSVREMFGSDLV